MASSLRMSHKVILYILMSTSLRLHAATSVSSQTTDSWYLQQTGTLDSCRAGTGYDVPKSKCALLCSNTNCSGFVYESGERSGHNTCTVCPVHEDNSFLPSTAAGGDNVFLRFGTQISSSISHGRAVPLENGMYPGRVVFIRGTPTGENEFNLNFAYTAASSVAFRMIYEFKSTGLDRIKTRSNCDGDWKNGKTFDSNALQVSTEFQFLLIFCQDSVKVYIDNKFLIDYHYLCTYDVTDIGYFEVKRGVQIHEFRMT